MSAFPAVRPESLIEILETELNLPLASTSICSVDKLSPYSPAVTPVSVSDSANPTFWDPSNVFPIETISSSLPSPIVNVTGVCNLDAVSVLPSTSAVTFSAKTFFHLLSEAPISWSPFGRKSLLIFELNITVSVVASVSPSVVFPLTLKLLVTVKLFPIVTSLGRPIWRVLIPATDVSISFVVPVIANLSESRSTVPIPALISPLWNSRSLAASMVLSTYALIDCWVARAVALSDAISVSLSIEVMPTKVSLGCPTSNWFIVAIPLILIFLPLISS